jgi:hypothetical protein
MSQVSSVVTATNGDEVQISSGSEDSELEAVLCYLFLVVFLFLFL